MNIHGRPVKLTAEANISKWYANGSCKADIQYPKILEGGVKFFTVYKLKTKEKRCQICIKQCGNPMNGWIHEILLRTPLFVPAATRLPE